MQRARNSAGAMRDPLMRDVVCAAFAHTVGGTFVNDAFEGLLRNETRCGACDTVTSRDEPFLALSLDIVQGVLVCSGRVACDLPLTPCPKMVAACWRV